MGRGRNLARRRVIAIIARLGRDFCSVVARLWLVGANRLDGSHLPTPPPPHLKQNMLTQHVVRARTAL